MARPSTLSPEEKEFHCPKCGKANICKFGKDRNNQQKYKCLKCETHFIVSPHKSRKKLNRQFNMSVMYYYFSKCNAHLNYVLIGRHWIYKTKLPTQLELGKKFSIKRASVYKIKTDFKHRMLKLKKEGCLKEFGMYFHPNAPDNIKSEKIADIVEHKLSRFISLIYQ